MQQKRRLLFLVCTILFLLVPVLAHASDLTLERDLQKNLKQSKGLLAKIEGALVSGGSYSIDLVQLKALGESIRTGHSTLLERFQTREIQVNTLGASAVSRHAAMQEQYEQSVAQYLSYLDDLNNTQVTLDEILQLKSILEGILPKKKRRIHGSVPYRHLNLPAQTPQTTPVVTPAYKGGDKVVVAADTAASPEAPISLEIARLAESLNWNPVEMYEWVKNTITTEWYWGAMKGAEETLRQKSGNDADQAALLVALFRSAGFPARYVRGVIEFFPDIEAAKMQTGLDDPLEIARFFQKAGIPYEVVIAGGRINNFKIEHVWVEAEIPYDNYRGAVIDEHGKTWLALDTSIKVTGYTLSTPADLLNNMDLSGIRTGYLADLKAETPLEYLKNDINNKLAQSNPGTVYEDLLLTRTINPEHMKIIPASLQFKQTAITGEYTSLPADLLHNARIKAAKVDGTVLFDQALPVYQLSNKSIALTFEPESVEDQEIMHAYGGLDNTPSYLIHLRPVLTVDGSREIVGQGGLSAGADFSLSVELTAPGASERIENMLIAGYPAIIGLSAQQAVLPETIPLEDKNAERLLFEQAMSYIDQGNKTEEELASLLRMTIARPLPTLVTLGGVLDVVYLLNSPHGYEWKGVYLDADQRIAEAAGVVSFANGNDPKSLFMGLSSLQGSILENRTFENGFGVESISTAKLLALANEGGIPVITIDAANINAELPNLNLPDAIAEDITNAVNQGYVVTLPEIEMFHEDWSGFGYIKENPATGESGWMLSGEIAGGMTAWNKEKWPEYIGNKVKNPFAEPANYDPFSANYIQKVVAYDLQKGKVDKSLDSPLQVIITDKNHQPVDGAEVVFTVKAGGGFLYANQMDALNNNGGTEILTIPSNVSGIAQVWLVLGKHTANNTLLWPEPDKTYSTQVGENIVDAKLASTGTTIAKPFTAFGFPGNPVNIKRPQGSGDYGYINSWAGPVVVIVEDEFGNPVSNQVVTFTAQTPVSLAQCANPSYDESKALLIDPDDACLANFPTHGPSCGINTLSQTTDNKGAHVQVVLGGMTQGRYDIAVTSPGMPATSFSMFTLPVVDCEGTDGPINHFMLSHQLVSDPMGNLINASKVNEDLEITAVCRLLKEKVDAGGNGTGVFDIVNNFGQTVTIGSVVATHSSDENGVFTGTYTLPALAQKNDVEIVCSAPFGAGTMEETTSISVYGVDIETPEQYIIPVDEFGIVKAAHEIGFTILPAEYQAVTSYVFVGKNGEANLIIPAETSGTGFATFTRGFQFDMVAAYEAQVVLNYNSGVEIRSDTRPILPIAIELDADMDRDGKFEEDDPAEYSGTGLIIPLNVNDDDGDGILDNIDGFDADGIVNADDTMMDGNGAIVPDKDLAEIRLTGLPATLTGGRVVLEAIQGADKVRIWTNNKKGKNNILIDFAATGSAKKEWVIGTDIADLSALTLSLYVEGIKESAAAFDTAILVTKYISPLGVEVEMDRLVMSVIDLKILTDYNRDRKIDSEDEQNFYLGKTFYFWLNDDDDEGEVLVDSLDDIPGAPEKPTRRYQFLPSADPSSWYLRDSESKKVDGVRDLLDFFPVYIKFNNTSLLSSSTRQFKLRTVTGSVNVAYTNLGLDSEGNYDFLINIDKARDVEDAEVIYVNNQGTILNDAIFLDQLRNTGAGVLLVEGVEQVENGLVLEVLEDNYVIMKRKLNLQISPVETMFRHKNLRRVLNQQDGPDDRLGEPVNFPDNEFLDKNFVFMHGFNVDAEAARGWHSEIFKRMFWSGSKARFYGVSWYGDDLTKIHFQRNVIHALNTSMAFATFVNGLAGETTVAAHSLGNMVVAAAIQDHDSDQHIDHYFMINAAITRESINSTLDRDPAMLHKEWRDKGYDEKLFSSEWYQLFGAIPDDKRSELTWRDRFSKVANIDVYNFYSPDDEVLANFSRYSFPGFTDADDYPWCIQELFKGRYHNALEDILDVSDKMGWGFNDHETNPGDGWFKILGYDSQGFPIYKRYTALEAETEILSNKEILKTKPFFRKGTDLDLLYDDILGNGYAMDNYHMLMTRGIPARGFAIGANNLFGALSSRDLEMSANNYRTNGWPVTEKRDSDKKQWLHSDIRDVAYTYNYLLIDTINQKGGLN